MKIAIAGATGFIGKHLVAKLETLGHEYTIITRYRDRAANVFPLAADIIEWSPPGKGLEPSQLSGNDALVNLTGTTVAQRWTAKVKQDIRDSRVNTTRLLANALINCDKPPAVFVNASAIGFYGSNASSDLDETSPPGSDLLSEICQAWETESQRAAFAGIRTINARIGIVLGVEGGALKSMLPPFKFGLGGPIGSGKQWMSWIHVEDVIGLIIESLANVQLSGPLNLTAPEPVTNRDFSKTLAQVLGRPAILPTPVFALKLLFGEFAQILGSGQRVLPAEALSNGYQFRFPKLKTALKDLV